jgi:hypothetical protein
MEDWAQELGQTVRAALQSWPATARLSVLIAALAVATWIYYHSRGR